MKTSELKIARIGNSRGIRLPAATLRRYAIHDTVIMIEQADGILLRPANTDTPKLTWEETAREMAQSSETWDDWDSAAADGLYDIPWETPSTEMRVAESKIPYKTKCGRK